MVQYEGHVTKDGELVVNLDGNLVSLREFLEATEIQAKRKRARAENDRKRYSTNQFVVAK